MTTIPSMNMISSVKDEKLSLSAIFPVTRATKLSEVLKFVPHPEFTSTYWPAIVYPTFEKISEHERPFPKCVLKVPSDTTFFDEDVADPAYAAATNEMKAHVHVQSMYTPQREDESVAILLEGPEAKVFMISMVKKVDVKEYFTNCFKFKSEKNVQSIIDEGVRKAFSETMSGMQRLFCEEASNHLRKLGSATIIRRHGIVSSVNDSASPLTFPSMCEEMKEISTDANTGVSVKLSDFSETSQPINPSSKKSELSICVKDLKTQSKILTPLLSSTNNPLNINTKLNSFVKDIKTEKKCATPVAFSAMDLSSSKILLNENSGNKNLKNDSPKMFKKVLNNMMYSSLLPKVTDSVLTPEKSADTCYFSEPRDVSVSSQSSNPSSTTPELYVYINDGKSETNSSTLLSFTENPSVRNSQLNLFVQHLEVEKKGSTTTTLLPSATNVVISSEPPSTEISVASPNSNLSNTSPELYLNTNAAKSEKNSSTLLSITKNPSEKKNQLNLSLGHLENKKNNLASAFGLAISSEPRSTKTSGNRALKNITPEVSETPKKHSTSKLLETLKGEALPKNSGIIVKQEELIDAVPIEYPGKDIEESAKTHVLKPNVSTSDYLSPYKWNFKNNPVVVKEMFPWMEAEEVIKKEIAGQARKKKTVVMTPEKKRNIARIVTPVTHHAEKRQSKRQKR